MQIAAKKKKESGFITYGAGGLHLSNPKILLVYDIQKKYTDS